MRQFQIMKRLLLAICFTILLSSSQAQEFSIYASMGYLNTRAIDKERPNYSAEITGSYRFGNHIVAGAGLSYMKTRVIWSCTSISPLYDREVYTLFATAGYDYKICKNVFATPAVEVGVSWIDARLNSLSPSERNERFSPFFGLGCDIGYRFGHFGLYSGISYYLLFDNHEFNPDQTMVYHNYLPHVDKYWHHFCFKIGMAIFLGQPTPKELE